MILLLLLMILLVFQYLSTLLVLSNGNRYKEAGNLLFNDIVIAFNGSFWVSVSSDNQQR